MMQRADEGGTRDYRGNYVSGTCGQLLLALPVSASSVEWLRLISLATLIKLIQSFFEDLL